MSLYNILSLLSLLSLLSFLSLLSLLSLLSILSRLSLLSPLSLLSLLSILSRLSLFCFLSHLRLSKSRSLDSLSLMISIVIMDWEERRVKRDNSQHTKVIFVHIIRINILRGEFFVKIICSVVSLSCKNHLQQYRSYVFSTCISFYHCLQHLY